MNVKFSVEQLAAATSAPIGNADVLHPHMEAAMTRFNIDSLLRQAAFLATLSVESDRLTKTEESLYYKDAGRLAAIYPRAFRNAMEAEPFVRNPADLGKKLYDGYWGRGLIQLTWKRNYERASEALGYDYVANPTLVSQPKHAALTAAWFWSDTKCNEPADKADMREVTRRVNGPALMHLAERKAQYEIALRNLS